VDHHTIALKLLRARIDAAEEFHKHGQSSGPGPGVLAESQSGHDDTPFGGHSKLGASSQPVAIQDIERA
jgi:hypothetical protein